MPNYVVEVAGEVHETVWFTYEVEAESEEEAVQVGQRLFEEDYFDVEVVEVVAEEIEENE